MSIADTIVPWTAEWLAFYEIWLMTGVWFGGGEWPPPRIGRAEPAAANESKERSLLAA